jgi:transcriptional regulator with XRE-family HTH domain
MPPDKAKKLGQYLKAQREVRGLGSRELARLAGIDDSAIVRIEQGLIAAPHPEKLAKIARALGIELGEVYRHADYPLPDLPSLKPYLRAKYRDLPAEAAERIEAYAERLARQHGVDLTGPAPGEDETPEEPTRKPARARKGGTR